jgi:hypothetical protein
MSFTLSRRTVVITSIKIKNLDLKKLKEDLLGNDLARETGEFSTEKEFIDLLQADDNARSLVFDLFVNSSQYGTPEDVYEDGETYEIVA